MNARRLHFHLMVTGTVLCCCGVWGMWAAEGEDGKEVKSSEAQTATSAATGEPKSTGSPVASETARGLGAFGQLLPMGQKIRDVQIPSFRGGVPSSLIRAKSMTKMDEERMAMEHMDIRLYGKSEDADVRVQLVTADYDMTAQVLTSEQRSLVSRRDFQLEGDAMIFDTNTQQGKMVGNVRMTIFDSSSMKPSGRESASPPSEAAPGQPAQTTAPGSGPAQPAASSSPAKPSPSNEKK